MRILRYILATLAVLATFTACREEDELNKAKGRVVLGEIRIEAEEANTRAIAIPSYEGWHCISTGLFKLDCILSVLKGMISP